jgi:serine/threonine protein kinase
MPLRDASEVVATASISADADFGRHLLTPHGDRKRRAASPHATIRNHDNELLVGMVQDWIQNESKALTMYGPIGLWDTSKVTTMASLFQGQAHFDEDLSAWNVSSVKNTTQMFMGASAFTSDLSGWDLCRTKDMSSMFYGASLFTTNVSSWQVQPGAAVIDTFFGTRLIDDYAEQMPCWYTGAPCPLPIRLIGKPGTRKRLAPTFGLVTVDPTEMSTTKTYHVGGLYQIAPLQITAEEPFTYSLIDAPASFYINPRTGVVIATFAEDDVTIDRSSGGVANKEPWTVTLLATADSGDSHAVVEVYTMHVEDRETFDLVRGTQVIDERFRQQYVVDGNDESTVVAVGTPFRIAARRVNQNRTTLCRGGFDDITFSFKVLDTATGVRIDGSGLIITSSGELLGEFHEEETGNLTIIITATDGGGCDFQLEPFLLDVRQRDVDVPDFGPNGRGCANNGAPVDSSGNLFDGSFTSCDCSGIALFVGENCEEPCKAGELKDTQTGKCAMKWSPSKVIKGAAAIAGALIVLMLLTVGAVRYRRVRRRMRPLDFNKLKLRMIEGGVHSFQHADLQLSGRNLKPLELKRSSVVLLEEVGRGQFGAVWKAMLRKGASAGQPEIQVAVKIALDPSTDALAATATEDLATEAMMMAQLQEHRNVVSIIGVVTSGKPFMLVLAYCDHGCVQNYLKKRFVQGMTVPAAHKIDFAAQTARGMAHLSKHHIIHRDLAARNVLLASGKSISGLICKVADFGLSRGGCCSADLAPCDDDIAPRDDDDHEIFFYRSPCSPTEALLPIRWTAPEVFEQHLFSPASDVWSFAIMSIEIIQDGSKPFPNIKVNKDVVRHTVLGQVHPEPRQCKTDGALASLYNLISTCFAQATVDRPSFADLAENLEALVLVSVGLHDDDSAGSSPFALELLSHTTDAVWSRRGGPIRATQRSRSHNAAANGARPPRNLSMGTETMILELASTYEYPGSVRRTLVEQRTNSQEDLLSTSPKSLPGSALLDNDPQGARGPSFGSSTSTALTSGKSAPSKLLNFMVLRAATSTDSTGQHGRRSTDSTGQAGRRRAFASF